MTGDSRSRRELKRWRALCAAPVFAFALSGCAFSFERDDGRREVIGLFAIEREAADAAATGEVRRFGFYGVWFDDAFRGTAVAVGEVQLAVAELRNQWSASADAGRTSDDCAAEGFGLRWCTLSAPSQARAGTLFDIAVAGVSVGVGARDRHFGVGYHRQTLIEATRADALIAWPALPAFAKASAGEPAFAAADEMTTGVQGLLRGSFKG